MSTAITAAQATKIWVAVESVASFRPAEDIEHADRLELHAEELPSRMMRVSFPGRALMPANTVFPDDPEVVAPVPGVFHVWVDHDGEIVTARHSNAGRLFPWPEPKVRTRQIAAVA